MPLTVVITRDVALRFRGFLASAMLEIAPGVYVGPRMSAGVRDRVWAVLEAWFMALGGGSIVMVWRDERSPGGLAVRGLGVPPRQLQEVDGALLVRRELPGGVATG